MSYVCIELPPAGPERPDGFAAAFARVVLSRPSSRPVVAEPLSRDEAEPQTLAAR